MAFDKVVDSTQLNADLTLVANAIRAKVNTSAKIAFPLGFVSAVQAIRTGITPKLVVETSAGASVTASKGTTTLSGTAGTDGTCTLEVSEAGEWNVAVSKDGLSKTQSIVIGTQTMQLPLLEETFSDNSWEQIIEACQKKAVPSTWKVGDSKLMTIDGEDQQIDIIGKDHDNYMVDGAMADKAPLTFQLHGTLRGNKKINSTDTNSGGWYTAELRENYMRYSILELMPENVATAVRALYKQAAAGNGSDSIYPMQEFTFLLCAEEVFGTYGSFNSKGEGTQYEYYKNGGSTIKIGPSGKAATWWLRSAYAGNSAWFCEVLPSGELSADNASALHSISFAFCF